jgi:hypothetical protein
MNNAIRGAPARNRASTIAAKTRRHERANPGASRCKLEVEVTAPSLFMVDSRGVVVRRTHLKQSGEDLSRHTGDLASLFFRGTQGGISCPEL